MSRRRRGSDRRHLNRLIDYANLAFKTVLIMAVILGYWLSIYSARVHYDSATICTESQGVLAQVAARCRHFDEVMAGMERFMGQEKLEWQ